ncbi:2,3-bisphosphoglycerate-independent phosphoglycerate mutase [Rickettsiales bacterium Ac37b]|nr:2,3-bisphosphoglycerate-independent phosphoglycerate mutase [Rickettsiales bacterium Ac37b]
MNNTTQSRPLVLCILDGWGIGNSDNIDNAITQARTPNWDNILENYPHSKLLTSGAAVGLPEGQMGNSEVGHMTIGSGRVIKQDLPRINDAINNDVLKENALLQAQIEYLKSNNKTCHLLGMLSDGGVHSHIDHIIYLIQVLSAHNIQTMMHVFLDGRDVLPGTGIEFIQKLLKISEHTRGVVKIATVAGRYFAMDRDQRWDRIEKSYRAIVQSEGNRTEDIIKAISDNYQSNITDEFIEPIIVGAYQGIENGDGLIMANFRADRVRQLLAAILDQSFKEFYTLNLEIFAIGMVEYSNQLNKFIPPLFPVVTISGSLPEIISKSGLAQLRIAETEKYAHVTFFLNGGREEVYSGEERILIPSPKVATYDLKPEMSARLITDNLIDAIKSKKFDLVVVNYANSDMVGHSGNMLATIQAIEVLDECLGRLLNAILTVGTTMLITADHGNAEQMKDDITGAAYTAHTTNPVPFVVIGNNVNRSMRLKDGTLADVAPTILHIMDLPKSNEMSGESLIVDII